MALTINNANVLIFTFAEPVGAGPDPQNFSATINFTYDDVNLLSTDVAAEIDPTTSNMGNTDRFGNNFSIISFVDLPNQGFSNLGQGTGSFTVSINVPFQFYNRVAHNETLVMTWNLTITDNDSGASDTEILQISITGTNDAPTAIADSRTLLDKFTTSTFSTSTFLNNDDDPDVVPTPDVFTMTSATLVNGFTRGPGTVLPPEFVNQKVGTVKLQSVNGTPSLIFTQNDYFDFLAAGESIKFKVNYSMNDGNGGTSSSVINLTLKGGATAIFAGNNAANNMLGENDKDTMDGKGGNDTIFARGGADILIGNAGNDKFTGGLGADQYFSGIGRDTTFINAANESGPTAALRDKFMDFVRGQDKINLAKIDSVAGGSDQAFEFIGTAAFGQQATDNRGQLRYGTESGKLIVYGDIGHNGTTDFSFQVNATPFADFFIL